MNIDDILRKGVESKCSDIHLKVGSHPYMRVDGSLSGLSGMPRVSSEYAHDPDLLTMTRRIPLKKCMSATEPYDEDYSEPMMNVPRSVLENQN